MALCQGQKLKLLFNSRSARLSCSVRPDSVHGRPKSPEFAGKKASLKKCVYFRPTEAFLGFQHEYSQLCSDFQSDTKSAGVHHLQLSATLDKEGHGSWTCFCFANVVLPCFWCRSYRGKQALNADVTQTWHQGSSIVISTHWITCRSNAIFRGSSGLYEVNVRGRHFCISNQINCRCQWGNTTSK